MYSPGQATATAWRYRQGSRCTACIPMSLRNIMTSQTAVFHYLNRLSTCLTHGSLFNQYAQACPHLDISGMRSADIRVEQLGEHLIERLGCIKAVFVAEAASGTGARFTGIPMTDERSLGGHRRHLGIDPTAILSRGFRRTSAITPKTANKGAIEMTAGIMWNGLHRFCINPRHVLLANVVPFHPQGASQYANRRPTRQEIVQCLPLLEEVLALATGAVLVPIGRVAEEALDALGLPRLPY